MKDIFIEIKNSVIATIVFAIILCGIYPLIVYGAGQLFFPNKANGSLIEGKDRTLVGSELLGQMFSGEKYFHPRPSAAGTGYDAANSSGTNLGPTSQKLKDAVKAAVEQYRKENNLTPDVLIPADAVTSSGSGLDPHISVRNAQLQTERVVKARSLDENGVRALIEKFTDGRQLGILGEPGVNVLKLNLALDGTLP
ncbi:MAG TPA: K(+)-transporting ATPase subunit C [Chthoniobacterales bacterium]|nr:K(+)-transporting ATPase subunit C [Chthoniobacterales bacterium]